MDEEIKKIVTLFMCSAVFWSVLAVCGDKYNLAIWLLLVAIFIKIELRSGK